MNVREAQVCEERPDLPGNFPQQAERALRDLEKVSAELCERRITFHQRGSDVFSGELIAIAVNGDAGSIDNLMVLVRPEKG